MRRLRFAIHRLSLSAIAMGLIMGQFGACGVTDLQARDFFISTFVRVGYQALSTFLQSAIISAQSVPTGV